MSRILKPRQKKGSAINRGAIETSGEVFSDGTILELVRPHSAVGGATLLRWNGKSATIRQHFNVNGKVYRPVRLNSTFLRALRLPGHITPYGATRDLFNEICELFRKYMDIAEDGVWKLTYFIFGNCLADRLRVAPFLFVIAPLGTPRAQLLRLLSCLTRRPLNLAEVTPAAISSLASFRPTFLFDEPSLSRRSARFLYASNSKGPCILRKDRIVDVFCTKVICSQEPLRDASLAGQALQITLSPAGRPVSFLEDSDCERIANEFQCKLLQYRLRNLCKIRTPEIDVSELAPPMQDVARALASCVADDEDLQVGIVQLLREGAQDVHLDSSTELGSAILEGLLFCCHSQGRLQVLCRELADIVNNIWVNRGEGRETTPESVGWKLRALDLRTEPIDGAGKGLRLTEAVRARIHALAQAYKVPSLRHATQEECAHCKEAFRKK